MSMQQPTQLQTQTNIPRQSGSLYVGDLESDVGENILFEFFTQVGPISNIRVCRDATTRKSLGYAYVNFRDVRDAERALDTLNYSMIKNRPCRIMWSQRDPSVRRSGVANVFVKNLDKVIESKSLYDTFSNFGNILSCKVVVDESGKSRGYGFIQFESKEMAEEAINTLNGMFLNDKKVYVGQFQPRKERKFIPPEATFTNVYVKNLPLYFTEKELQQLFEQHGPCSSVIIMRNVENNSRGFGFVNFKNHDDAIKAINMLNNQKIGDKELYVARAQKKSERNSMLQREHEQRMKENFDKYQGLNLYVKNLDENINDEQLKQLFESFGTITSAKVMLDESKTPRGFGFVCFSKPEDAEKAIKEMHNKMISNKPLYVSYAQRKEVRRAQLEAQYNRFNYNYAPSMNYMQPPIYAQPPYYYNQPPINRYPPYSQPFQTMQRRNPNPSSFSHSTQSKSSYPLRPSNRQPSDNRNPRRINPQNQTIPSRTQRPRINNPQKRREIPIDYLDISHLADYPQPQRKEVIGNYLFRLITQSVPNEETAKIVTTMLLNSTDDTELIHLTEDKTSLDEKIEETLKEIEKSNK